MVAGYADWATPLKSGSGCPDPYGPSSEERKSEMLRQNWVEETGVETSGQ